jgi:general secretion pathway protein J
MMHPDLAPRNGFTLVELMVALGLFGLIAGASVAMLAMAVSTREATQGRLDVQAQLLQARALLNADLGQAVPRRWRDEAGRPQPAFASDPGTGLLLRVVRAGWSNPDAAPRASLQRVEWRLADGVIERRAAPMVDGAPFGPPARLLKGVRRVRLRVHSGGAWGDGWPSPGTAVGPDALPQAVELVFDCPDTGQLRQLFLLPPQPRQ